MNEKLLKYFNGDELAANVWKSKYVVDGEEWKFLEDSKHAISDLGRVANIGTLHIIDSRGRRGKVEPFLLKLRLSSNGYYITFNNNLIHRLIAINFIGNPNNYNEISHINGNKLDNSINNLEWCSRSGNIKHAYKLGLRVKHPEESSKITREDVNKIRNKYSTGNYTQKELGKKFGLKQQAISKIINYKRWK